MNEEYKYIIGLSRNPVKDIANGDVEFDVYVTEEILNSEDLIDGAQVGIAFSPFKEKAKRYNKADSDHICALIKSDPHMSWKTVASILVDEKTEAYERLTEEDLPEFCYTYVESDRVIGVVKRGVVGYYPSNIPVDDNMTAEDAWSIVKHQNEILGVSEDQARDMTLKSMFGWNNKKEEYHRGNK